MALDEADRLTRLEDALIDLANIVSEGHLEHFDAHIALDMVEAGKRLQALHETVISEWEP